MPLLEPARGYVDTPGRQMRRFARLKIGFGSPPTGPSPGSDALPQQISHGFGCSEHVILGSSTLTTDEVDCRTTDLNP
jgi:hypothetical protein